MGAGILVLAGNLGQDPELQYTQSGTAFCRLSLPVDVGWGENKDTEWVKVTAWGKDAERCAQYLRKGSMVQATCELEKTWVSDQGKASIQAKVIRITFLAGFGKQEQAEETDFAF